MPQSFSTKKTHLNLLFRKLNWISAPYFVGDKMISVSKAKSTKEFKVNGSAKELIEIADQLCKIFVDYELDGKWNELLDVHEVRIAVFKLTITSSLTEYRLKKTLKTGTISYECVHRNKKSIL